GVLNDEIDEKAAPLRRGRCPGRRPRRLLTRLLAARGRLDRRAARRFDHPGCSADNWHANSSAAEPRVGPCLIQGKQRETARLATPRRGRGSAPERLNARQLARLEPFE